MVATVSTVWGTKPDVTTLLGEDTLTIPYPSGILAGDILAMVVIGTIAGSTVPSADGTWTGAVWNTPTSGNVRYYWPPPVVAVGGESGNITITKGSSLSRLIGAIIVKFDAFTFVTHQNFANFVTTTHNGNPNSGGTPLTIILDDGSALGIIPDITKKRKTYSIWYVQAAGNSGHPVTETFAGPDTETFLSSSIKDENANPNNANTLDRFLRVSGPNTWLAGVAIPTVTDVITDTSGFANPNQTPLTEVSLRFAFVDVAEGNPPPGGGAIEIPQSRMRLTKFPNRVTTPMLGKMT
jgi:hypothetical protein